MTQEEQASDEWSISSAVADNLRRLRSDKGLSLAQLAELSGVSRAMLNQIERGKSTPTIAVVWKIATAFGVPFSELLTSTQSTPVEVLRADRSWQLRSQDGSFSSRALFPLKHRSGAEFYQLRLRPRATEAAEPHRPGTTENLVVHSGRLTVRVLEEEIDLGPGDAILFPADVPHGYDNRGEVEVVAYLVMNYER